MCVCVNMCMCVCVCVHAPTNSVSSVSEANQPSEEFYNEVHSVLATTLPIDMIATWKILMLV